MTDAATIISQAMDQAQTAPAPTAEQQKPIEQVAPQVSSEPPKGDDFNKRFEALAAKEREIWKKSNEIKLKEDRIKQLEDLQSKIDKDPWAYLQEKGTTYETLAEKLINNADGKAKPLTSADAEKLREQIKQEVLAEFGQKQSQEKEAQHLESTIKSFKDEIAQKVESTPDYVLVKDLGEQELVWQVIEEDYKRKHQEYGPEYANKNLMQIDEAAKKVNQHLVMNMEKMLQLDSVKNLVLKKLGLDQNTPKQNQGQNQEQITIPKTLTNDGFARSQSSSLGKTVTSESDRMKAMQRVLEGGIKPQ